MCAAKPLRATTRRDFLQVGIAATSTALASSLLSSARAQNSAKKPNLLFIYTEGQRWDALSLAGNPILKTPNQDSIGREGVVFKNSFCTNALCAPSRVVALTGLYSHITNTLGNDSTRQPIRPDIPLVTDLLHEAGYKVAMCGKAHLGNGARERYWDYYFAFNHPVTNYYRPRFYEGRNGVIGQEKIYEGYADDLVTDRALSWLREDRDGPFCLLLWYQAPHAPFFRARRHLGFYDGIHIPVPDSFDDDYLGYPGKPRVFANAQNKIGTIDDSNAARSLEELVKDYCAGLVAVDENIGRVRAWLEQSGQLDDTAILQSSDHGFFLGEWRSLDKRFMHEPSIRVPTMLRYPKEFRGGTTVNEMVLNLDIAPTLLDLAGIEPPKHMQGHSFVSLAKGTAKHWRRDWLYEYSDHPPGDADAMVMGVPRHRGIRTERYKFIHYYHEIPQEYELYDLKLDPGESRNLYGDPQYLNLQSQLAGRMEELRRETGDTLAS